MLFLPARHQRANHSSITCFCFSQLCITFWMFWKLIIGWIQISSYFKVCRIDFHSPLQCSNGLRVLHMHVWANQSAIDRPGGQSEGSMYMVQHMATTLIGGRARACGWNWRGKSNTPYFQKGPINVRFCYTRTYRLVLYWFAHCICVRTCTYAREGANQMHKLHAGGQSERSEPISKMCMEMVRKNFLRISWKN